MATFKPNFKRIQNRNYYLIIIEYKAEPLFSWCFYKSIKTQNLI